MKTSIAIASHNEGNNLWRTVRSCLETTRGLNPEIVVVDDGSTDGSIAALAERHGADVKIVPVRERRGVAYAKDLAIRSTRGEIVVMVDAHCKPEPGALERLVRDVTAWRGDAVVCPRLTILREKAWRNESIPIGFCFWLELEGFRCEWLSQDEVKRVAGPDGRVYHASPALSGAALALSRELYERVGGFDAGMLSWGAEDVDFGLKTWLLGHQVLCDFEAVIGHRFRSGAAGYSIPEEHVVFNNLRMARKNFGDRAWEDWFERAAASSANSAEWQSAVALFEAHRESVELERHDLLTRRRRDEYWYAHAFQMAWPLTLPGSPYPVSQELAGKKAGGKKYADRRTQSLPQPARTKALPKPKSPKKNQGPKKTGK
jgi:GT2 family glycosyltransferase